MKRYYAHYTFIYPDIFLTNHILEIAQDDTLLKYYPFEREVAQTEFHSGLQVFIPHTIIASINVEELFRSKDELKGFLLSDCLIRSFTV